VPFGRTEILFLRKFRALILRVRQPTPSRGI
jgi:hypothetical protein